MLEAKEDQQWGSLSLSSVRREIEQVHQVEEVVVGEEVEVGEHQRACAEQLVQVQEEEELCEVLTECFQTGLEEVVELLPAL